MRYIIVGGDAAGMSAASRLKRRFPDSDVRVYEKTGDVSYSACGMPYNIADPQKDVEALVVRTADAFRNNQGIDLRTGHTVTSIDRTQRKIHGRTVQGDIFEDSYDYLLIATGAGPVIPDIPGTGLEGVFVLKTLQDTRRIKTFLQREPVSDVLIVGMGYIALEMAESLVSRGLKVRMIKKRPQLLPWMVPELSDAVKRKLEEKGVELVTGAELSSIERKEGKLIVSAGNEVHEAGMVLLAMGVKPLSELAAAAGLGLGASGAVAVDEYMRTSDERIFAAGDCAVNRSVVTMNDVWIPLALTANRGGRIAADNMAGDEIPFDGIAGTAVFKVFELEVARTGLSPEEASAAGFDPVWKPVVSRNKAHGMPGSENIHAVIIADRESGRLLGAQMVGGSGTALRINAAAVALHSGLSVAEFYQCDLAYAPPFGPVWDPLLIAASSVMKGF